MLMHDILTHGRSSQSSFRYFQV